MGKNKHQEEQRKKQVVKLKWLPVYMTLLLLPLIKIYKLYESRLQGYAFYTQEVTNFDYDLYGKQALFIVIAGITVIMAAYLFYRNKRSLQYDMEFRKKVRILLPLGVYLCMAFLSALFSDHKYAAFTGSDTMFESFFALLGYVALPTYLLFAIETEEDVKHTGAVVGISMAELSILGILQYSGHDLLQYSWYQKLIMPAGYDMTLQEGALYEGVVLNAYNPNYAGVLLCVLSALCLAVLLTEKKPVRMLTELILFLALVTCLIGTSSKAGLLVLAGAAVIAILFLAKKIVRLWYLLIPAVTFVILAGALFIQYFQLPILDNIERALAMEKAEENPLSRMVTTNEGVEITYKDVEFKVELDVSGQSFDFNVTEKDGTEIPLKLSENYKYYTIEHEVLGEMTITPGVLDEVIPIFVLNIDGRDWLFSTSISGATGYYYLNPYNNLEKLVETRRFGFAGYERLASGRGLIWSQTLPLLKNRLLVGEGPNNFIHAYPQNNYKDIFFYSGSMQVVSRPHCMYLQIAVETGVLSLIALLVFWGWYLLQSVKIYFKSKLSAWSERIGFACFIATVAYLVCGLTNDSMITVAPLIWCIIGIGLGANKINRELQEKEAKQQLKSLQMKEKEA